MNQNIAEPPQQPIQNSLQPNSPLIEPTYTESQPIINSNAPQKGRSFLIIMAVVLVVLITIAGIVLFFDYRISNQVATNGQYTTETNVTNNQIEQLNQNQNQNQSDSMSDWEILTNKNEILSAAKLAFEQNQSQYAVVIGDVEALGFPDDTIVISPDDLEIDGSWGFGKAMPPRDLNLYIAQKVGNSWRIVIERYNYDEFRSLLLQLPDSLMSEESKEFYR